MLKYCAKRLARSVVSLAIIVAVVFSLLRLMPVEGYFSQLDQMTEAQINNELEKMGLNDPVPVQLGRFYAQILRGDLGKSTRYRDGYPVAKIVKKKAPISIKFGLMAMGVSLPLGMLLGILMAKKKNGIADKLGTLYIILIQAVPSAVYYLLIQLYGTSALKIGLLYDDDKPITMILPILSLALPSIAGYAMWLRRYMVDEENKDYIKMAKAKGVPKAKIARQHVFRNAVVPMVQFIPGSMLLTIAGSIYVESLYSIPGMGGLLVEVIKRQDNNMVQGLVIIFAVLGIFGLLLGDLLMALVDPRISLTKKEGSR
ncbi:MAG: ABC transporter permease [Lachnospiraceae bacterium]|nr:ABC transporter permease [Lachnospiraceae bacterium]MBP5299251.1 ABC transporter permease [Lachnospiraceae bacterium]